MKSPSPISSIFPSVDRSMMICSTALLGVAHFYSADNSFSNATRSKFSLKYHQ